MLNDFAERLWIDSLIDKGEAKDPTEALVWINDLKERNPDYHNKRLSYYRKQKRDEIIQAGELSGLLHESSMETLGLPVRVRTDVQALGPVPIGILTPKRLHELRPVQLPPEVPQAVVAVDAPRRRVDELIQVGR